jgi:hypothetical protein
MKRLHVPIDRHADSQLTEVRRKIVLAVPYKVGAGRLWGGTARRSPPAGRADAWAWGVTGNHRLAHKYTAHNLCPLTEEKRPSMLRCGKFGF